MTLPAQVAATYLAEMDRQAPGLVRGLYLVGSVALGDFRRGSDIDFVAVTDEPLGAREIDVVRRVHLGLDGPWFNGPYVTWTDLANDPRKATPGVHIHDNGVLRANCRDERHPVMWHTLAQCGQTVRGPGTVTVWTDPTALAESVRENLDTYWRPWHTQGSRPLSNLGLALLTDWAPVWAVLGVSRLHYTLATGRITSKSGAGDHARTTFGARWHRILDECLRLRQGRGTRPRYLSRRSRRRETLAFLDHTIRAAHQLG